MSNLLIDEHPMMVLPSLANRIGLDNAVVLQQINYWVRLHEQSDNERLFHEGRWWVFNTIEQWQAKQFTWWSVETVKRIIATLEKMGLVISDTFNVKACDRKKWYTIDYDAVDRLKSMDICCIGYSRTDLIQVLTSTENPHLVNLTQGSVSGQSDPMVKVNLTQFNGSNRPNDLYKETKEETTSEITIVCDENPEPEQAQVEPVRDKEREDIASQSEKLKSNRKNKNEVTDLDREELQPLLDLYNQEKPARWDTAKSLTPSRVRNLRRLIKDHKENTVSVIRRGLLGAKRRNTAQYNWSIDTFIKEDNDWCTVYAESVSEDELLDKGGATPSIDINSLSKEQKAEYERKSNLMAFYAKQQQKNGGTAA